LAINTAGLLRVTVALAGAGRAVLLDRVELVIRQAHPLLVVMAPLLYLIKDLMVRLAAEICQEAAAGLLRLVRRVLVLVPGVMEAMVKYQLSLALPVQPTLEAAAVRLMAMVRRGVLVVARQVRAAVKELATRERLILGAEAAALEVLALLMLRLVMAVRALLLLLTHQRIAI
jgi:hypothetical protein